MLRATFLKVAETPIFIAFLTNSVFKANLDQIITPQKAKLGHNSTPTALYICCKVKIWSKICLFISYKLVQVVLFFCFLFSQISFALQKEEDS